MPKKHKRLLQRIEAAEAKREAANKRWPRSLHVHGAILDSRAEFAIPQAKEEG